MPQMKKQEKTPKKNPKAMEVSHVPDKEFKEMVVRMLNKLESTPRTSGSPSTKS